MTRRCVALVAISGVLAACDRTSPPPAGAAPHDPEISWASAALARNPTLEVLATDANTGVFTVRMKGTGEVRAVKLAELAAAPIAELSAQTPMPAGTATGEVPAPNAVAPTPSPESRSTQPITPKSPTAAADSPDATVAETNPSAASNAALAQGSEPAKSYTIERAGGQVKVSGPGVSIVSSGKPSGAANNSTEQRNAEPVICEGRRMLHLDNRVISAQGDAVIARGGCELYITNSRISAAGTAVIAQDAVVHIANSTIEGGTASFDADDRAKLFLRSSTFKGLPRRGERAVVQDQGGNQWR
jgi:hypothetical protein